MRSRSRCSRGGRRGLRNLSPNDIHVALEIRAVFDHDACGLDIAYEFRFLADVDPVSGLDVPVQGAQHDHLAGFDAGANLPVRADRKTMFLHLNGAFHFAVDG